MTSPRQAVILAAGASTRTHPLTIQRPKPLLPLLNKPILQHTLEQLDGLVDEAILVVGFEHRQIERFFGDGLGRLRIRYCLQKEQRGTGHALQQARPLIGGSFLLLNGDDLLHRHDLERLAEHDYAILCSLVSDPRPYGVLDVHVQGYVTRIVEKPDFWLGRPLVNTGAYHFQPQVFQALDDLSQSVRGEYELVDVIRRLPGDGRCVAVETERYWLPIGYPWKLLEANLYLLERTDLSIPDLPGASVTPPVVIGRDTTIEAGCIIGPGTTIGAHCKIAAGSRLVNCLVMDHAQIGPDCYLEETIVGERAVLGAGVRALIRPDAGGRVHSAVKGKLQDTGRETLGAVIGDGTQIGAGCTLNPGVKIWPNCSLPAGSHRRRDLDTTGFAG